MNNLTARIFSIPDPVVSEEDLGAYIEGSLPADEIPAVEAHLDEIPYFDTIANDLIVLGDEDTPLGDIALPALPDIPSADLDDMQPDIDIVDAQVSDDEILTVDPDDDPLDEPIDPIEPIDPVDPDIDPIDPFDDPLAPIDDPLGPIDHIIPDEPAF